MIEMLIVILAGILLLILIHYLDRRRIAKYIASKGGILESIKWTPFGKGWIGDESNNIFSVTYMDKEGQKHKASVKTGLFSSVYFTDDQIID